MQGSSYISSKYFDMSCYLKREASSGSISFEFQQNGKQTGNIQSFELPFSLTALRTYYHKVASSNRSPLVAHAGFFILLMKVIFDPYVM